MNWIKTTIQLDDQISITDEIEKQINFITPAISCNETESIRPTTDFGIQTDPYDENASFTTSTYNNMLNHSPDSSPRQGDFNENLDENPLVKFLFNQQNIFQLLDKKAEDIKIPLDYLTQKKCSPQQVIDDEKSITALNEVNTLYRNSSEKINLIIESKLHVILKELLGFVYAKLVEYVNKNVPDIDYENANPTFTLFHLIVNLIEILVVQSKEFAGLFHIVGGTKCILGYFDNMKLTSYLTKSFTSMDPFKDKRKFNACKSLASMLNTLLYIKTGRHQTFKEFRTIEILTKFTNNLSLQNCELILRSHLVLAEICSRKQIEMLVNIDFSILILEKTIQMLAQACLQKTKCNFYEFDLFFGEEKKFEICSFYSPNTFIVIILNCMEAFLVNDDIIYRAFGSIKDSLVVLLINGDLMEKYLALSLLVNFCFDDILCETMRRNDTLIIELLDKMLKQLNLDESIRSMSFCLRTLLRNKNLINYHKTNNSARNVFLDTSMTTNKFLKKILISYHETNDLICFRIRNELELLGYDVVINEKKLVGTLDFHENLVKSIEDSDCVLVCYSSSYESQLLCRFEAFYATKLRKMVLPINVQDKYVPDYWIEKFIKELNETKINLNTVKDDIFEIDKIIKSKNKTTDVLNTDRSKSFYSLNKNNSKICQIL